MKITEADLRRIIEEELKTIANSKHPSDVEMIEDPNVGGILSDPFEHVPADVPAVVDKPQARVQHLTPIVKERRYSLRALLEQDSPKLSAEQMKDIKAWANWLKGKGVSIDNDVATDVNDNPQKPEVVRQKFLLRMAEKLGDPNEATNMGRNVDMVAELELEVGNQRENNTGYNISALIDKLTDLPAERAYRKTTKVDFSDDAVGGRDPAAGEVDINEARFVGGFGFGAPPSPTLSEVEDLDECGCDNVDMPSPHLRSAHDDHEGSMARSQLRQAAKYSQKLGHMINESDNLPEWVEAKITKASDYLSSVYEYIDNELNGK